VLGRFIQADPLGYWGGQSLYAYVDGRPYDAIDPTGLRPPTDGEKALLKPIFWGFTL
jgi:uncharacterized protein RhaS with RHS repeats